MIDAFLINAILAGLGVVVAATFLGCFVVWRRMAYFGDATAHAAILGVALSLMFSVSVFAGVLAVATVVALLVVVFQRRGLTSDTLLGVLAHGGLATGLVAVSLIPNVRVDLDAYLFGDILAVGPGDLVAIWAGALAVAAVMAWRWSALLTVTLNPDLAEASGIAPRREELVLTLALALTVAVAIKVVGALLITALLIIPAAAARPFSSTPEGMAVLTAGFGAGAVLAGVWASFTWDTPTGPTIVCAALGLFLLSVGLRSLRA
ncbi:MAG: metal ABC transporter permease [Pseudomonadota bacterium]